jgi:hypothetical protein
MLDFFFTCSSLDSSYWCLVGLFIAARFPKTHLAWQAVEPFLLMAEAMPRSRWIRKEESQQAKVPTEVNVKDVLTAVAFLVILVSPAFTALNVFTGKNRF